MPGCRALSPDNSVSPAVTPLSLGQPLGKKSAVGDSFGVCAPPGLQAEPWLKCRAVPGSGAVPAGGGGGVGTGLPQGQPWFGAGDGDCCGDGGLPPPLPPGLGPISNVSWHHMALALFVLLRLGKEGSVSLSGRGGGTQAQEYARVPWDRRLRQALHISSELRVGVLIPGSRGVSPESRCRRFTHPRGAGAEAAPRVRARPGAEHDRPATGRCL